MQLLRVRSKEPREPSADSHKYGKWIQKQCLAPPKGNLTCPNHPHNPDLKIILRHESEGTKNEVRFQDQKQGQKM